MQRQVICCLLDVARGVRYIHSKSVIHGDLNPSNVLLKERSSRAVASSQSGPSGSRVDSVQARSAGESTSEYSTLAGTLRCGIAVDPVTSVPVRVSMLLECWRLSTPPLLPVRCAMESLYCTNVRRVKVLYSKVP